MRDKTNGSYDFFGFQYLTTVIPYDDFDGGPSTKVLLQLIESRCLILYFKFSELIEWLSTSEKSLPSWWYDDRYNLFVVMDALLADSPTVPGLLTEYILKGECKAASDIYTSGSDVCNLTVCKESHVL